MPRIAFRVDGSSDLGLGHVMRCMALADSFTGWESHFWTNGDAEVKHLLGAKAVHCLPDWLNQGEELELLEREIRAAAIDAVVIDFLRYPKGYLESMKQKGFFLVTLHEYERECRWCDVMVNCNTFPGFESVTSRQDRCLGPDYVILRDGVRRHQSREALPEVQSILVSMGGSDPNGVVFKAASGLAALEGSLSIIIHIGPAFKHRQLLGELSTLPNVQIEDQVGELADLMMRADLAVAAGGNTMYELCFLGVPSIIIAQNEHQREFADGLAAAGAVRSLGLHSEISVEAIAEAVRTLCSDQASRQALSRRGRELIDGKGAERIVDRIIARMQERGVNELGR